MIRHLQTAALAAAFALAGTPAFAQEGGAKKGPAKQFERLDKNNDGVVDRDEYEKPAEKFFKRADADGDGVVDAQETKALVEKAKDRKPKAAERLEKRLERMDRDGDGKLTREEAMSPPPWFKRLDENDDGKVDKAEIEKFSEKWRERDGEGGAKDKKRSDAADPDQDDDDMDDP